MAGQVRGWWGGGVHGGFPTPDQLIPPQEWTEGALFTNVLRPTLDRERWGWDRRHLDFELYKRPPPFVEAEPPKAMRGRGSRLCLSQLPLGIATAQASEAQEAGRLQTTCAAGLSGAPFPAPCLAPHL